MGRAFAANDAGRPGLRAERRTAAAGALYLGVVKFEAGGFQSFHVIHCAAVQVHQRSGIHKNLEVVEAEDLVHHAALILESH